MAKIINLEEWLAENKSGKDQQLFLSEKQVRSFKQFENSSSVVYVNLEIGENQMDIPVQITNKNQTEEEFKKDPRLGWQTINKINDGITGHHIKNTAMKLQI